MERDMRKGGTGMTMRHPGKYGNLSQHPTLPTEQVVGLQTWFLQMRKLRWGLKRNITTLALAPRVAATHIAHREMVRTRGADRATMALKPLDLAHRTGPNRTRALVTHVTLDRR